MAAALTLASVGASLPAWADPIAIDQTRTQIALLETESSAAAERLNGARAALQRSQERLGLFARQATSSRIDLLGQSRQLELMARQLYVNGGVNGAVLTFSLDDPDGFLASLDRLSTAADAQVDVVTRARQTALSLRNATAAQAREEQRLAAATTELGVQQAALEQRLTQLRALLASLQEEQRLQLEAEAAAARAEAAAQAQVLAAGMLVGADGVAISPATSPGAAAAVSYALAQVGKPYVWGAPGPDSFDCSGLTRAAWAQAGVRLTHYSGSQYAETTPVAKEAIQPGDLLYFYSISQHVGIYIGNGTFVHAANSRTGVVVSKLDSYWSGNFVAASRPAVSRPPA